MRGLERLQAIRRQRLVPDGFVTLWAAGTNQRIAFEGSLLCEAKDSPENVDLRCLTKLPVHVIACGNGRLAEGERWAREAIKAGARSVLLSVETTPAQGYFDGPVVLRWNNEDIA